MIVKVGDLLYPNNRKMVVAKELVEYIWGKSDATFQENIWPLHRGNKLCYYSYPVLQLGMPYYRVPAMETE